MGPSIRRHPLATFLLLAFGLTWLVWVPRAMASQGLLASEWPIAVGQALSWGPAVAALLAAAITGGRAAVRELGARLVRWRVGWPWYAVVLAGPAAFSLAVAGAYAALGGSWVAPRAFDGNLLGLIPFFVVLALTDGLGEELGWRGYALPRLLARHGALAASLSLGVVWALWHLPLVWTEGAVLYGRPVWLPFLELPAEAVSTPGSSSIRAGARSPRCCCTPPPTSSPSPRQPPAASWGSPCSVPRRRGCWRSLSSRPSGRVASRAARDRRRRRRPEPRRPWVR